MKFDYIGAPWNYPISDVGNGGLSLRRVETMLSICKDPKNTRKVRHRNGTIHYLMNEDIYFAFYLQRVPNVLLPTKEQAREFSVETIYYGKPVGLHRPHFGEFPKEWTTELFET
jgi:hypothetical protein